MAAISVASECFGNPVVRSMISTPPSVSPENKQLACQGHTLGNGCTGRRNGRDITTYISSLSDTRPTDAVFRVDISSPGQILTSPQPIQLPNLCKPFEFVRLDRRPTRVGEAGVIAQTGFLVAFANHIPLAENASCKEPAKYSARLERAKYAWDSGESTSCGCSERKASIS